MSWLQEFRIDPEIFENRILSFHLKPMRLYGFVIGTNQKYELWHYFRGIFFTLTLIYADYLGVSFLEKTFL